MPIYEYEPLNHDCFICEGRVEALQGISDEPLTYCPTCGLEVRRVVSRASIKVSSGMTPERAAQRGFTTFKRSQKGTYERIAGEGGPEMISATEDSNAGSKKTRKVVDLDNP
jgi:putative FmdB family regulatory protein